MKNDKKIHIQYRVDDTGGYAEFAMVSFDEEEAFDYWLGQDRTNGTAREIVLEPDSDGFYNLTDLVKNIKKDFSDDEYDEDDEFDEIDDLF